MQQGDIVIINFPFTSLQDSKIRPALVVSNRRFNGGENVVLLAISTQQVNVLYCESLVQSDLKSGQLLKESYVRFSNILSLEKKLILKKVGRLGTKKLAMVQKKVRSFFR